MICCVYFICRNHYGPSSPLLLSNILSNQRAKRNSSWLYSRRRTEKNEFLGIINSYKKLTLLSCIVAIIGVILLSVKITKERNSYKEKFNDVTFKDDDSYWKLGIFYYNRENPSIFVEKRSGIGFTINAGSIGGIIFYAIIVILIVVPLLLPTLIPII